MLIRKRARSHRPLALVAACLLTSFGSAAYAQQPAILDDLLEKLKDKGVLTKEEYDTLKAARDQERTEQRAERRKEALKAAQQAEKEEKAKEEAKSTLVGRWRDGFVWESGDKQHSIGIGGRIQFDYRHFDPNGIFPQTFDIRRAYMTLAGKIYNDFTFDVTADFANPSGTTPSYLDVAWINWGRYKEVQLRGGQFKMPFSIEELTSSRFIDFQERSLLNAFVPAKERGAMVWGIPFTGVTYGLALSNGQGKNNNEVNAQADGFDKIARLTGNFAEMLSIKDTVLHLGGDYSTGQLPTSSDGATGNLISVRTEGRGITFFQVPNSSITGGTVTRQRVGGEVALAYGPLKFQGEYLNVDYKGQSLAGVNFDREVDAYYLEALWMLTGEKYAESYRNGAWARIKPKSNFTPGGGWGAWELAVRYSAVDGQDFKRSNPAGTGQLAAPTGAFTNKANAWTVGLKWIMNPNVRMYLNYVRTNFGAPLVNPPGSSAPGTYPHENAITMRLGIDF